MAETIAGDPIGVTAFLSLEEDNPLGICVFHDYGVSFMTLEEFMDESVIDLSAAMRQRYAGAFEIMAKRLRENI